MHSSQKYVVRHKEFVGWSAYPGCLSRIFLSYTTSFMFAAGKHNECKDMETETVLGILGITLYTQPVHAQKSVTDTVRLNFNMRQCRFEEVVVKEPELLLPTAVERYASGGTGHGETVRTVIYTRHCRLARYATQVKPVNCWYVVEASYMRRRLLLMECMY